MQSRRAVRPVLVLAIALATLGIAGGASAASVTGTIKLDPPTTQVDNGGTFNIKVISNTTVPISGLSASIKFDKSVVQVTSITRATAWASAPLFLAADAKAIATANSKGVLQNVAVAFFPPGTVPAGTQDFITVGFKATACGTANMTVPTGRVDSNMLDGRSATYGNAIKITTTGATVTVCQGGGGASPGASDGASPGPSDSSGVLPSDSIDPNASPSVAPSDAPQPSASGELPSASTPPVDNGSGGTTQEQSGWLTFAMAALAIAAAGLATLILVLTIAAIVAAVTGAIVVIRVWNRYNAKDATSAGDTTPATPPESATADTASAASSTTGSASGDASTPSGAAPTGATPETAPTPPDARQP
jgi:hypothetical protein